MYKKIHSSKYINFKPDSINLFILPSLLGFLIFFFIPFIGGFYYATIDNSVNGNFVWLENFKLLLSNDIFLKAVSNTLLFMAICVPLNMIFSLAIAIFINNITYKNNFFRMLFISPLVIPVASVAFFWQIVFEFHGPLNYFLNLWSIESIDWINTGWARVVILIVYLWKNIGYNVILYLAGLNSIPDVYYESANIDGASTLQKFYNITLVYLTPMTFFIFIISIINSFKTFREIYLISGEYPHESIYMIQHYMNNMFNSLNYQKLTTSAYILASFIMALVFILFNFEKKISSDLTQ